VTIEARVARLEEQTPTESPITRYWREFGYDYLLALARGSGRDAVIQSMRAKLDNELVDRLLTHFELTMAASITKESANKPGDARESI